jgi:hypothetical protein
MSDTIQMPAAEAGRRETGLPTPACCTFSAFLPLAILAASFLLLLAWQVHLAVQQRRLMKRQFAQRVELVAQSDKVQGELKRLVDALMRFAKYDAEAKALLDKYGISATPAAAAPEAAPATP